MATRQEEWLAVGRARRAHGVHGDVLVEIVTDFPERMAPGVTVGFGESQPQRFFSVHSVRHHKGAWLLALDGVRDRDAAEQLAPAWVFLVAQERSSLPENYYYEHELVGCRCRAPDGADLGQVAELLDLGGGTLLRVTMDGGREVLVPFRSPIVVRVDLASAVIHLDPPEGLFSGDAL
ncbi:MAG: ribosome maturation factor RimM [Acidobacteriota bacterium]